MNKRVCHKYDDMPFFFRYFNHFILQTQPLHSANKSVSFCLRIRIFETTKSYLQASAIESSSQRSRIFKPAQSDVSAQ